MTSHWTEQSERSNKTTLSILAWLALHLGRRFILMLLYPIAAYFLLTARKSRRASRAYLSRALGRVPTIYEQFRHFYTFAVVSVDRFFFLSGRLNKFDIELHGRNVFDKYVKQGQGCILLVSHMGSFDVMRVPAIKKNALPLHILMDRKHNKNAIALLEALNPELAKGVLDTDIPAPELALTMEAHLRKGEFLGIMADRAQKDERVAHFDFMGSPAAFPMSPWSLSLVLKVPVILCFGLYRGKNRYTVHFELLTEQMSAPRKMRDQVINQSMSKYVSRLEHYAKLTPYNWFNFYDFWSHDTTQNI